MSDWSGKRVTVMGLGRFEGGVGVTRWLAGRGARVTVTDRDPAEKLRASLAQIESLPNITLRLGGHDERDFVDADLVVVNPAVPPSSPYLAAAQRAGVPVSTEINLFVERCPATTVGITGSVGKSTTTAMIGHVLERCIAPRRVWVGGNLGHSLLDKLHEITPQDVVVLELSSFQLERTALVSWSPHIAVLTNLSPNHLDWHGDFDAYAAAKLNIARYQDRSHARVIVQDDPELVARVSQALGAETSLWRTGVVGVTPVAFCAAANSAATERVSWPGTVLDVPGRHNLANAGAALTVAHLLGIEGSAAMRAVADFAGLPHRLQRVGKRGGVTYYNDSKATTPEAAITAMNAIDGPLLVILGGYDKGSDLTPAARLAAQRARFAACVGKTGPTIAETIVREGGHAVLFERFEDAVAACRREAREGDVVLLSPACASWGMFEDYRQRGDVFAALVRD